MIGRLEVLFSIMWKGEKGDGCEKGGCEAVSHLGAKKFFPALRAHTHLCKILNTPLNPAYVLAWKKLNFIGVCCLVGVWVFCSVGIGYLTPPPSSTPAPALSALINYAYNPLNWIYTSVLFSLLFVTLYCEKGYKRSSFLNRIGVCSEIRAWYLGEFGLY